MSEIPSCFGGRERRDESNAVRNTCNACSAFAPCGEIAIQFERLQQQVGSLKDSIHELDEKIYRMNGGTYSWDK